MSMPKVSVVVTSYRESAQAYLIACVNSLNWSRPESYAVHERIVVTPKAYQPALDGWQTLSPPEETYGMPRGLNFGIDEAFSNGADFAFVANDDVIVSHACIERLVSAWRPELGVLIPIGNDTNLGRYHLSTGVPPGPYRLEQLDQATHAGMIAASSPYPPGLVFYDALCLYAFLISREAWERIGPFDETLIGQDDIDYSFRSRQAGLLNAIELSALCYHAGGASNALTPEQRAESMQRFNEKWSAT